MTRTTHSGRLLLAAIALIALNAPSIAQTDAAGSIGDGNVLASVISLGTGASASGWGVPTMGSTAPILGHPVLMTLRGMTPSTKGCLYMGPLAAAPTQLGSGSLYLDLNMFKVWAGLPFATDAAGTWIFTYNVPNVPSLAGFRLTFQALNFVGPKIEITNAILAQAGY